MSAPVLNLDAFESACLVLRAGPDDATAWNGYVAGHDASTFFHRFEWADVIERTYGHKATYLMAKTGERITGVLPLVHVKSPLFGTSLISTAFTVGGGVLADDEASAHALVSIAADLGVQHGVDYVELRGGARPDGWHTKDGTYAGFIADMPVDEDAALSAIPRKKRADVRKGIKAAEAGDLAANTEDEPDTFYRLYAESVRNLGTPVPPLKLFRSLKQTFGEAMEFSTVKADGVPVAALASFYHRDTVLPYYGGASPVARQLHAYDYMYFAQMRRAVERGCTRFDFGRSKTGTGAYDYKRHWGFEPQPLTYHYHLVKADQVPDVNPNNPKFRLLTKAWQRLPLALSTRLGPIIAGQLG